MKWSEIDLEWKKDYTEIQGQMIAGESISFDRLIQELKRIVDTINFRVEHY